MGGSYVGVVGQMVRELQVSERALTLLRFYSQFHGRVPTMLEALMRQPFVFWVGNVLLVSGAIIHVLAFGSSFSFALVGLAVGALLRDIGWMLRFKRDWPVLDSSLDWAVIHEKIRQSTGADA